MQLFLCLPLWICLIAVHFLTIVVLPDECGQDSLRTDNFRIYGPFDNGGVRRCYVRRAKCNFSKSRLDGRISDVGGGLRRLALQLV